MRSKSLSSQRANAIASRQGSATSWSIRPSSISNGYSRGYVLHFDKRELPPVDAFWSVTAYDSDGYFIPTPLKRQAIGDRDKLVANADGSVDLYIQADSPGTDKESNWLPVGKEPFTLLMRLYSRREEFLEGKWEPPAVNRQ
ncbi:DUF1214 domain-containing protein [Rhizobium tibeticum]|uniref:DUF1214 domain-containing protein n=1 Tax=Rhizobium tibeticum TaxID=501024 RepID=UPI0027D79F59|nr:DUF1214 domain-containing protein [Rhizobium tibeticum]